MPAEPDDPTASGTPERSESSRSVGRRIVLASGAALGAGSVAGCLHGGIEELVDGPFGGDADVSVAIVSSPSGFGDGDVADESLRGLNAAASAYDVEVDVVEESEPARFEDTQATLAEEGYDLIVCVGASHRDGLEENVPAYPDQRWVLVGEHYEGASTVSRWIAMNHEAAFLAGVAAGTLTREEIEYAGRTTNPYRNVVGFVGYDPDERLESVERSYVEGANWVDEDVVVIVDYVAGSYTPHRMLLSATAQYELGADIVYQANSSSTGAVFAAALENDRFALGAEVDQSVLHDQYANIILGSGVTFYGEATFRTVEAVVKGDWNRVAGEQRLGIENEGVGFVAGRTFDGRRSVHERIESEDETGFWTPGEEVELPDVLYENLAGATEAVVSGEIELACGSERC